MEHADQLPVVFTMPDARTLRAANINPASGLATDFLNPFNEYVMLAQLVADGSIEPEALSDWRPVDYEGHFAASGFADCRTVLAAYRALDRGSRRAFEMAVVALVDAILDHQKHACDNFGEIGPIRRKRDAVAALITGESGGGSDPDFSRAQASVDALFD